MKLSTKSFAGLTAAAMLMVGAQSIWADMDHDHHHGDDHEHADEPHLETAEGVGELIEIHAEDKILTMHHEPMDELNWPAMTMDFQLKSLDQVEGLEPGDEVRFVMQHGDGNYTILELEPR